MELTKVIVPLEIKQVGDDGDEVSFEGIASMMGIVDFHGEVIDEGAFTRTLKHKKGEVILLADHNPGIRTRLGVIELQEDGMKLKAKGFINTDKEIGKDALSDLRFSKKRKTKLGLSIGFNIVKEKLVEGIRHFTEVALWEVSLVTFPANPKALIGTVKSVVNFKDYPLTSRERHWDSAAAV